jgi:hypothetical protein
MDKHYYYSDGTTSSSYIYSKMLHRVDGGPAVEYADGSREWWVDGNLHRVDGPAYEGADGSRQWWVDGKRHRVDGPAYEGADGSREWWVDGKLHRVDGPAYEGADGSRQWWVGGERLSEEQFEKHPARLRYLIEKSINEELSR